MYGFPVSSIVFVKCEFEGHDYRRWGLRGLSIDECPDVVVSGAALDVCCCGAEGVGRIVAAAAAVDVVFHSVNQCHCLGLLSVVVSI